MRIGSREFDVENRTYVMGILNVTPDSFSDGGKWNSMDRAMKHVEEMLAEGMDILDIGGESTRPGSDYSMPAQEELERVMPYIEAVKARFDVPISLDTYKSQVAEAGIAAGVDLINDIWGLKWDDRMAQVIADHGVACCLMHNRRAVDYKNFLEDVASDLAESVELARRAGIGEDRIILDPGVGFAKSYEQNLAIINQLESLRTLGYPVLLGTSRKSVVGLTLDLPVEERLEGTLATTVIGVLKGCSFVRVHDVKENVRAIRMVRAILEEHGMHQKKEWDEIHIDDLEVYAHHGVFPEEKEKGQLFYVNLVLYTDTRKAGQRDELTLSTHYGEVCHLVTKWMQEHTYDLIETVAETVAEQILLHYPLVQALDVEIRKPQAPIGLPFGSVSVKIRRGWHQVYIALGSNMGDREKYLQTGVNAMKGREDIRLGKVSSWRQTVPYGGVEQEDFLNGVMEIRTLLTPQELLDYLHEVEQTADRKREIHWGPRTLDLDILLYDDLVMESEKLIIPHVDMQNRDFVLGPMAEIAPWVRHPVLGLTMGQLYAKLTSGKGR